MLRRQSVTRGLGDIAEDVSATMDTVMQALCGSPTSETPQQLLDRLDQLQQALSNCDPGDDTFASSNAKKVGMRIKGCIKAVNLMRDGGHGPPTETQTIACQTDLEGDTPRKRTRRPSSPPPSPQQPKTPEVAPSTPTQTVEQSPRPLPAAAPFPPPIEAENSGVTLGEGTMVRIATDLVFSIMKVASREKHFCSLAELFIECDRDGDGFLSFTEIMEWIKGPLGMEVKDWELSEFGRRLKWGDLCRSHPQRYIDQRAFLQIMRGVWGKVKWYFSNAVLYGVPERVMTNTAFRRRHIIEELDVIRQQMYRLIRYLVIKNCHVQYFFQAFDSDRSQKLSAEELARAFWELREVLFIETEEESLLLAQKCCWLGHQLFSVPKQGRLEELSLYELQELVREFFTEFSTQFELNVLAGEDRSKFLFRHIMFGACGVLEDAPELASVSNIFSLFAKYSRGTGYLRPADIKAMLETEFKVHLTETEVMQLIMLTDQNQDRCLDLKEFADLLDGMHMEVMQEVRRRMPQGFQPGPPAKFCMLEHEVVNILGKLILKLLQTDETFGEFFDTMPQFRPIDFITGDVEHMRYPDEMIVGLRRLGIDSHAKAFDGWGGPTVTGIMGWGSWGPARHVVSKEEFLQAVWSVWERLIEPRFLLAMNWNFKAGQVAYLCLNLLSAHLSIPPGNPPPIQQAWGLLDVNKDGSVSREEFIGVLRLIRKEKKVVWPNWALPEYHAARKAYPLAASPVLPCSEVPLPDDTPEKQQFKEDLFVQELQQLFHLADITGDNVIEQAEFERMYLIWCDWAAKVQSEMAKQEQPPIPHNPFNSPFVF
eukprot:Sspe_Gene.29443::Locus_13999_Transcript_1_1_Confidence_1.000_Length_2547::g.29443::m.29443